MSGEGQQAAGRERHAEPRRGAPRERKLGRGLEDFSHLFFSAAEARRASEAPARSAPAPAPEDASLPDSDPLDNASWGEPRSILVTGFRRGCGKTFVASAIAESSRRAGAKTAEWQLGPGVVVPRRGERFDRPMPHPDDRDAFGRLVAGAGVPSVLVLDGPVSLVGDGDPFALAAEEFVVIALPGREGAAEAYAAVKEIATALPHAAIRIAVNRSTSQGEAGEIFHLIADVAERHLGRVVRSYGGLPSLSAAEMNAIKGGRGGRALLFQRIARSLARPAERPADPSYFEEVWGRLSAARG